MLPARGRQAMKQQCCNTRGGPASYRLVRRISAVTASILPAAALVLLPKCPLCLAAWLTVMTGVGFSAAGADLLRWMATLGTFLR